jgi:hypothetical protein
MESQQPKLPYPDFGLHNKPTKYLEPSEARSSGTTVMNRGRLGHISPIEWDNILSY